MATLAALVAPAPPERARSRPAELQALADFPAPEAALVVLAVAALAPPEAARRQGELGLLVARADWATLELRGAPAR